MQALAFINWRNRAVYLYQPLYGSEVRERPNIMINVFGGGAHYLKWQREKALKLLCKKSRNKGLSRGERERVYGGKGKVRMNGS